MPTFFELKNRMARWYQMNNPGAWSYTSVVFDGTNDYLARGADLTGITDGVAGTCSFWLKMGASSDDNTTYYILKNSPTAGQFNVYRDTGGSIHFYAEKSNTVSTLNIRSSLNSVQKVHGWVHVIASWNLVASPVAYLYVNGVSDIVSTEVLAGSIDYTASNWGVGATYLGANKLPGLMSELYFTNEFIDISVPANLAKFISGGKPVNLGPTGALPTGTQAILYLHNNYTSFGTNSGSGGNLSVVGTLDDGGADKP